MLYSSQERYETNAEHVCKDEMKWPYIMFAVKMATLVWVSKLKIKNG